MTKKGWQERISYSIFCDYICMPRETGRVWAYGRDRKKSQTHETENGKAEWFRKIFMIPSPMEIVDETHIGKK